jgi:hypothetical protein
MDRKRAKTDGRGHEQLLFSSPLLQTKLGTKFCDEAELLPLLLAHGLVRRVCTIEIEVRPLGGDSFKIKLDATHCSVGDAKVEIARAQGTKEGRQELYKWVMRADGGAVREDDAEPELLDDDSVMLRDQEALAMAVKESPLLWLTFDEEYEILSEDVVTQIQDDEGDYGGHLVTSGTALTSGKHYWEVELLSTPSGEDFPDISVGVSRPGLSPRGDYTTSETTDGWFIGTTGGALWGNGEYGYDDDRSISAPKKAGNYEKGDRVGVLLNLNDGSLQFFKNGHKHGVGFSAGSVTGPVVHAVQMEMKGDSVRLVGGADWPLACKQ